MIDMSISDCKHCGTHTNYINQDKDTKGDIFRFDLCIYCEDKIFSMMNTQERLQTLCRWTFGDRR